MFRNSLRLFRKSSIITSTLFNPTQIRSISFLDFENDLNPPQQKPYAPKFKKSHIEFLAKYYPKNILESILIAESEIDPNDWKHKKLQMAGFAPNYLDDLANLDPYYDHPNKPHVDISTAQQTLPEPDVPYLDLSPEEHKAKIVQGEGNISNQNKQAILQLSQLTGYSKDYISQLTYKNLIIKRVSNQTAKGKIPSFYCLGVIGDGNGMVGIGEGKDKTTIARAMAKAQWNATKNLKYIPRYENRTILGDIDYRYHGVKLFLRSASPGFGLRVNHYIFEVCQCAGIKDLSGKVYKSRNGMNIVKGFVEALTKQKTLEEIALARGKKVIDVRKSYYSNEY
ncbi:mitochondrial 37S ribosomal protein uS5m ASCRUDRAFT_79344 [Ascoidea rubescens DSM 1968]|uniref:Small ribosomal subunit protein uS5m n=1 Tax=Ascoidea rubescens DSM 1968 TaxID=1344418 RepID=A0A1D2VSG0_9ASCO|nr:hypothetical protein ASCRUDRAFT_79344 [Ascoidea rubescens DSM 1968]ODV64541.1 hypothetical protein ASCRUDRAFT_79344 [Ascoidea rubescens DSM 1968]